MAKCANCENPSFYSVKSPGAHSQEFCKEHLPKFFNAKRLPDYVTQTGNTAPIPTAPKTKKKDTVEKTAPTAPALVEVEAVAEIVVETPEVTE